MSKPSTLSELDTTSENGIDSQKLWPIIDVDLEEYNQTKAKIKQALHNGVNNGVGFRWCKIRDELSVLKGCAKYDQLLCDLTDAALYYLSPIHSAAAMKKGAPKKPSVRILMYDVRLALKNLLAREVGLHQTQATDEGRLYIIESAATAIARLVAESVGVQFTKNVRNHIRKAQHIHVPNL